MVTLKMGKGAHCLALSAGDSTPAEFGRKAEFCGLEIQFILASRNLIMPRNEGGGGIRL